MASGRIGRSSGLPGLPRAQLATQLELKPCALAAVKRSCAFVQLL
jgi:hypothetical protein